MNNLLQIETYPVKVRLSLVFLSSGLGELETGLFRSTPVTSVKSQVFIFIFIYFLS